MFLNDTLTPTSAVENCFFKKIVELIDPSCELRGRMKLQGILGDLASRISAQIRDVLKSATAIIIAMKCWTSKSYSISHVSVSAAFSRLSNSLCMILLIFWKFPILIVVRY